MHSHLRPTSASVLKQVDKNNKVASSRPTSSHNENQPKYSANQWNNKKVENLKPAVSMLNVSSSISNLQQCSKLSAQPFTVRNLDNKRNSQGSL